MSGLFAADGSINITVVSAGGVNRPVYAADGSINVVKTSGTGNVGASDASGAWNVSVSPKTLVPARAPDGSLYVQTAPYVLDGGQRVTVVSGSLGPGVSSATYYIYGF